MGLSVPDEDGRRWSVRGFLRLVGWVGGALLLVLMIVAAVGCPPFWKRVTMDVTEQSPVLVLAYVRQETGADIETVPALYEGCRWPVNTVTFKGADVPIETVLDACAKAYGGRVRRIWRGWRIEELPVKASTGS